MSNPELTLTDPDGDCLELRRDGEEITLTVIESDVASMVVLTPVQQRILAAALQVDA